MISNPLSAIWVSYQTTQNCFKVTKTANKYPQRETLFAKTDLLLQTRIETLEAIQQSLKDSDDLFVVFLWATFERFARLYLQNKGKKLREISPKTLASSVSDYFENEVEFWKAEDLLELLKTTFAPRSNLVGGAKQILQYRNWIAHGKKRIKFRPMLLLYLLIPP